MANPEISKGFEDNRKKLETGEKVLRRMPDGTMSEFDSDQQYREALENWDSK